MTNNNLFFASRTVSIMLITVLWIAFTAACTSNTAETQSSQDMADDERVLPILFIEEESTEASAEREYNDEQERAADPYRPEHIAGDGPVDINTYFLHKHAVFVDDDIFEIIKDAYSEIDYYGAFEKGDIELYDFYIEQYLRLLRLEAPFYDRVAQAEYYANEKRGMSVWYWGAYDPDKYIYYLFDMDKDGTPELCVVDEGYSIIIVKYYPSTDSFILWHEVGTYSIRLLGSMKLFQATLNSPQHLAYIELDERGEEKLWVRFYIEAYTINEETGEGAAMYLITLPYHNTDGHKYADIPEKMMAQSVFNSNGEGLHYFRVTEAQFKELTDDFYEARWLADETIMEVRYTFEELFGRFLESR